MTAETADLSVKSFEVPDETMPVGDYARVDTVKLGQAVAHRATFQPGFRWSAHVKPVVGTDLCEIAHTGYVLSGRAGIRMADGTEREIGPGDAFDIRPGHDVWTVGDEAYVAVDFVFGEAPTPLT